MAFTHSDKIMVKRIPGKGRGVFATADITEGEIIERTPVLVFPYEDDCAEAPCLKMGAYYFLWRKGMVGLPLGYGALYNHSYDPNANYLDDAPQTKTFVAIRDIAAGEEITINYNGSPEDRTPVGFEVR